VNFFFSIEIQKNSEKNILLIESLFISGEKTLTLENFEGRDLKKNSIRELKKFRRFSSSRKRERNWSYYDV